MCQGGRLSGVSYLWCWLVIIWLAVSKTQTQDINLDFVLYNALCKPSTPSRLHTLARGLRAGNGLWQSTWKGRVDILEVGYKTNMEAFHPQSHFLRTLHNHGVAHPARDLREQVGGDCALVLLQQHDHRRPGHHHLQRSLLGACHPCSCIPAQNFRRAENWRKEYELFSFYAKSRLSSLLLKILIESKISFS